MSSNALASGGNRASRALALWLAAQAAGLVGLAGGMVGSGVSDEAADLGMSLGGALVLALFAAGLVVVARRWWKAQASVSTATAVWHVLVVLVGIDMMRGQGAAWGWVAATVGAVGLLLGWQAVRATGSAADHA